MRLRDRLRNGRSLLRGLTAGDLQTRTPRQGGFSIPSVGTSGASAEVPPLGDPYEFVPLPRQSLDGNLLLRFRDIVAQWPDRPVIDTGSRRWTYQYLAGRMLGLANRIRRQKLPPDRPVALFVDQGPDFVLSLLAVLQAGHFWVPLDPEVPEERNRQILEESRASLLLTLARHTAATRSVSPGLATLEIDGIKSANRLDWKVPDTGPEDLAYVLFTSGSTGRPKGVMQTHRNVLHNALRHINTFETRPADRQSLLYPCTVYGGVRDIFNALLSGACLCRYSLSTEGIAPLPEWLERQRITQFCSVATVYRQLIQNIPRRDPGDPNPFPDLRIIKIGGEAVYRSDVEAYRRCFGPQTRLSCGLGATEVGGATQFFVDYDTEIPCERVSCGEPMDDVTVQIVDPEGRPLPKGTEGEIAIESAFITTGYWQRPDLTAAVLTEDPRTGRRLYRTGDLGVLLENGELVHRGRNDHQIKIHGNRVEIPEIESTLLRWEEIHSVVVKAESEDRVARLVAFVVPQAKSELDAAAVRNYVRSKLPAYMVPGRIEILDEIPTLPNGKVDHRALAGADTTSPVLTSSTEATIEVVAGEQAEVDAQLRQIWRRLFRREPIADSDDFFELGGDSVMLMDLTASIDQAFGRRIPLSLVARASQFGTMRRRIESILREDRDSDHELLHVSLDGLEICTVPLHTEGDRPPIFFVAPAGGVILPYLNLARLLPDDQPFYAVSIAASRPLDLNGLRVDIVSVAEVVAELIDRIHPEGAVALGGWSFGGFVAYELAQQRSAAGRDVENLWILDAECRLVGAQVTPGYCAYCTWLFIRLIHFSLPLLVRTLWQDRTTYFQKIRDYRPESWLYQWRLFGLAAFMKGIREYPIQPSQVPVTLIRAGITEEEADRPEVSANGWDRYVADLEILPTLGNHFTMFRRDHIDRLVALIRGSLGERRSTD